MQRAVWGTQEVEVTGDGAGTVETRLRAAKHSVPRSGADAATAALTESSSRVAPCSTN